MDLRAEHYIHPKATHRCLCGVEIHRNTYACRAHRNRKLPRFSSRGYRLYGVLREAIDEARR
jgi:hypothetical protein